MRLEMKRWTDLPSTASAVRPLSVAIYFTAHLMTAFAPNGSAASKGPQCEMADPCDSITGDNADTVTTVPAVATIAAAHFFGHSTGTPVHLEYSISQFLGTVSPLVQAPKQDPPA